MSTTVFIQHLMINFISINQTCVQPTTISCKANQLRKNLGNYPELDGKLSANERVHKAMSTDFGCVEMSMSVTLDHSNCAIDLLYSCIYYSCSWFTGPPYCSEWHRGTTDACRPPTHWCPKGGAKYGTESETKGTTLRPRSSSSRTTACCSAPKK